VERTKKEAQTLNVTETLSVADFHYLNTEIAGTYTIVLSCDNALPHLLTDDNILMAIGTLDSSCHLTARLLHSIISEEEHHSLLRVLLWQ
jgi:glycine/sarcosine N-methyltransferase